MKPLLKSELLRFRAAALAGIERHYLRDLFRKHGLRSGE